MHSDLTAKPHQKEQRLYSKLSLKVCAPQPISQAEPSHSTGEAQSSWLCLRSNSFRHQLKFSTIDEGQNGAEMVDLGYQRKFECTLRPPFLKMGTTTPACHSTGTVPDFYATLNGNWTIQNSIIY